VSADPVTWLYGLQSFGVKLGLSGIRALLESMERRRTPFLRSWSAHEREGIGRGDAGRDAARPRNAARGSTPRRTWCGRTRGSGSADATSADRELDSLLDRVRGTCERGLADGTLEAHPSFFEVMTARRVDGPFATRGSTPRCWRSAGGPARRNERDGAGGLPIVTVDLDHTRDLGGTLAAIAGEKAGIVRAGGSGFPASPNPRLCGPSRALRRR